MKGAEGEPVLDAVDDGPGLDGGDGGRLPLLNPFERIVRNLRFLKK